MGTLGLNWGNHWRKSNFHIYIRRSELREKGKLDIHTVLHSQECFQQYKFTYTSVFSLTNLYIPHEIKLNFAVASV